MQVGEPPSGEVSDEDTLRKLFASQPEDAIKQQTLERKISWKAVKDISIAASYGVLFAFIAVLTRQLTDGGVTAFQVVVIQEGCALLMTLGLVLWSRTDLRPANWRIFGQLVLLGVGKYFAFGSLVLAITCLPPANVAAVNKSTLPLFVALGAYIFLRHRPSFAACIGGILCTAGIVLVAAGSWKNIGTSRGNSAPITGYIGTSRGNSAPITGYIGTSRDNRAPITVTINTSRGNSAQITRNIDTSRDNRAPIIGVSLAILSALIESLLNVQLRYLLVHCMEPVVLFYTYAVAFIIGILPMLTTHTKWDLDVYLTIILVLCGGFYAVSAFIYVKAAKAVPPVTQMVLCQLEVGVTFLLQFTFLGFVPNVFESIGAAIIAVGSLLDSANIVIEDSRKRKRLNFRKQLGFDIVGDDNEGENIEGKTDEKEKFKGGE
ncbi:uncharacterized protein LOC118406846 [Branchiostoma floridae]|uniref:Uncharacterized protein LOC118406846 n=1 Tax=Branchiostoma floridae TaxID=7739 RepID=A0A9J7HPF0_BRAFL|nr:uncharacterized protein LOC118406846 [Branchiostoma floridae]